MSAPDEVPSPDGSVFSTRTVLALVMVGVVSLSALAVLATYAPAMRAADNPGAHALSSSAVGFRGAIIMMRAEGVAVGVGRAVPPLRVLKRALVVLTPPRGTTVKDLRAFDAADRLLIVLPKWSTTPDPLRPGFVRKAGVDGPLGIAGIMSRYAPKTELQRRAGLSRPSLHGGGEAFRKETFLALGPIDRLQTISGDGWRPALVDDQGRMVLARSKRRSDVFVLADPDLLDTQGLADLDTARAGSAVLSALKGDSGILFDVTLNGIRQGGSIGGLLLEPPWLAATLCAFAAALLTGAHAFARFGAAKNQGRALALGQQALVDNSAGLVRMARKEPEFAPAYAALTRDLIGRAAGSRDRIDAGWLADLARRRGAAAPEALAAEADKAKTRSDLLTVGRKLYDWRQEITRERR